MGSRGEVGCEWVRAGASVSVSVSVSVTVSVSVLPRGAIGLPSTLEQNGWLWVRPLGVRARAMWLSQQRVESGCVGPGAASE